LESAYTPPTLNDGKKSNYGFGWVVREKDGKRMVWHNGGWAGTRTHISRWLNDRITVVVLCNDESANPDKTGADVAKLMRGESLETNTATK
jgi:CubicO group peptidase (beta-lactamase class C family)